MSSIMDQLKAQLQIDRNIAEDDTVNVMPDAGNVAAFAQGLVSAALPTNEALKARQRFGSENGIVTLPAGEVDDFGGNDNNRRVAARIEHDAAVARGEVEATVALRKKRQEKQAVDDDVIGQQRELDRMSNPNNAAVDLEGVTTVAPAHGAAGATADGAAMDDAAGMPGAVTKAPSKPGKAAAAPTWKPQG